VNIRQTSAQLIVAFLGGAGALAFVACMRPTHEPAAIAQPSVRRRVHSVAHQNAASVKVSNNVSWTK